MSNDLSVVPLANDVSNMEVNETNSTISSVTSFKVFPKKTQKQTSQSQYYYYLFIYNFSYFFLEDILIVMIFIGKSVLKCHRLRQRGFLH